MEISKDKTTNILSHRKNLRFKLIIEGAVVGLITGIIIVLNRLAIDKLFKISNDIYSSSKGNPIKIAVIIIILSFLGYLVGVLVKKEPMISGSGIPQVEGFLVRKLNINWLRVLINKFIGGVICLGVGLSAGREGPSVQMGAAVGQGFSRIFKRVNIEEKFLTTSGASAGLAAAFNAPLSGVMFALEETHKNFSPLVLLSAMSSALTADFVAKRFLGLDPALNFKGIASLPLKFYWALILLGVLVGISGTIFNKGILKSQKIYGSFKRMPIEVKTIIPFIVTGIVGVISPILIGGGHNLIMSLSENNYVLVTLLLFLVIKFLLVLICFGSGIPGGIFFPLLVLGALVGNIFGIIVCYSLGVPSIYILTFIILAMAGHFTAIVKAPITGIILITEMTGSFDHMLPLAIVCIFAYITSDLLKSEPIYESLLENILKKNGSNFEGNSTSKTLIEYAVHMGCITEGQLMKDINWPKDCLIVAIKRGGKEIIPRGFTRILSGDYIVALVDEDKASSILEKLDNMCTGLYNN
ncbi:H(+)/Cl(-) exchange transporter ClcA [Clostridium senegalense]|uniref:H(+)/Cl(-) exchange transporter ClcA n=1 Tax=Clostridium senegalense TaxID=1465809 RepID=UPI001C1286DD|nr:H(+)/Cl(-) exchange transporter ClcA [Clostridium senegalense]MBU5225444.1 H(+)/Cl(-) exchange transporter ClcA [Clostridium senegalense]